MSLGASETWADLSEFLLESWHESLLELSEVLLEDCDALSISLASGFGHDLESVSDIVDHGSSGLAPGNNSVSVAIKYPVVLGNFASASGSVSSLNNDEEGGDEQKNEFHF